MQSTWQDIIDLSRQFKEAKIDYWLNENLFTFNWWLLFVTTIGTFVVWIILLDKKRIFEIVTYGLMVGTIALFTDALGTFLLVWNYPVTLTPPPIIFEIHKVQMPIIYMIIYQYFTTWRSFSIAALMNAFIFAFILEPFLVWLQIYEPYHWKHAYSVLPYFFIAIGFKWLMNKFKQWDKNYE